MAGTAKKARPKNCTILHVRRHFNEIADALSKRAAEISKESGMETREAVDKILGKEIFRTRENVFMRNIEEAFDLDEHK